jgi:hypothetical protein
MDTKRILLNFGQGEADEIPELVNWIYLNRRSIARDIEY